MKREHGVMTDSAPATVAMPALAPGAVIAGRYRLLARLGGGGGGTVWRCHDDQLGAPVALKIVAAGGDVERWRREVAMARRIADRNVCRVHDLGETGDLRFVTMELIEGTSLRRRVRGDLPVAEARALFAQIAAGAAAIHAAGVVHRDLKPENIVVAGDGRAVIVDFGLAREPRPAAGATVTNAGVVVGTPRYMSPEQATGDAVDARTDVWALGLIGHELLTGVLPGSDAGGRFLDPRVDARWPGAAAVLRRCLTADLAARYADARELRAAIAGVGRSGLGARVAFVAVVLGTVAGITALALCTGSRTAEPRAEHAAAASAPAASAPAASAPAAAPGAGDVELFPIVAEPPRWPSGTPVSVAVSRDGKRFAYTTAGGDLLVQSLAPGAAPDKWTAPKFRRTPDAYGDSYAMMWCVGWFGDDTLGVIGSTYRDGYQLLRVGRDGRASLLHGQPVRFTAAIAGDDRAVFAIDGEGLYVLAPGGTPDQIAKLAPGERALAVAVSPDAHQVAVARQAASPDEPARIEIVAADGGAAREVWRGASSAGRDMLLVWPGAEIAFTRRDPATGATTIHALDPADPARLRARGTGGLWGPGSAAAGTALMLRSTERSSVLIGDARLENLAPVEANRPASHVAGWTRDGRLVFALGEPPRIVRAWPGRGAEPWPGTRDGVELPDSVVGDSVIAHRCDPGAPAARQVVVERIGPAGERSELLRLPADRADDTPVRCAGDSAAPCLVQDIGDREVSWTELDPASGERKGVRHSRGRSAARAEAALSLDGKFLAIVEGSAELTVVGDGDRGTTRSLASASDAALDSVAFAPSGDIWATAVGFHGRLFGAMAFEFRARWTDFSSAYARGSSYRDALRRFSRPTVSPDGRQVAAWVHELHSEIVRIQGL